MSWFEIHYAHVECNAFWSSRWSCACNDRCPVCSREIEPEGSIDLTAIIEFDESTKEWVVSLSPPEAENSPRYRRTAFKEKRAAEAFLASSAYA